MKTGLDLLTEDAMMNMVDPRPIELGHFVENFVKYLEHAGLLAGGVTEAEKDHLITKIESMVRGYLRKDRREFHGIDVNTTEQ